VIPLPVINGTNQRLIAFIDEGSSDFSSSGEFPVVRVEFFDQIGKAFKVLIRMVRKREILISRIITITLYSLSIIIFPALIAFSYFLKDKIELAYTQYGREDTIKLITMWGIFGLLIVILNPRRRKS